jgi:hypothetical protein
MVGFGYFLGWIFLKKSSTEMDRTQPIKELKSYYIFKSI